MQATAPGVGRLSGPAKSFLDFCRVEKGLAANSLHSYQLDLQRLSSSAARSRERSLRGGSGRLCRVLVYGAGLSARSIARHITTLRNFYGFLTREGDIDRDPTEFLTLPRQWTTLPKYLNREEVERLLAGASGWTKPTGLRDRAMLEMLYATGLRVTELCRLELAAVERRLGRAAGHREGQQAALVPFGEAAREAMDRYLGDGRPRLLKGRASRFCS